MKKVLAVVAAVGCLSAAGSALGGVAAGTGVNGSLHDMTKVVGIRADKMERVCVYCHTPHNAVVTSPDNDDLPLWNHNFTVETFTPYKWASPNNKGDGTNTFDQDPLLGPTRLCMSCHDGSVAIDQHGVAMAEPTGTTSIGDVNSGYEPSRVARSLINDLTTTHPIGFDYNAIAAYRNARSQTGDQEGNTEIVESQYGYATAVESANRDQGQYNLVTRNAATANKAIKDNLYDANRDGTGEIMTCATCHEVHNKENATQETYTDGAPRTVLGESQSAPNYFLYAKQARSLICLSCHVK